MDNSKRDGIDRILEEYKGASRDALIPILQKIQEEQGYLSEAAIAGIGEKLNLPTSKIYGVATFYNMFRFKPLGKYHFLVCRGTACHVKGSERVVDAVQRVLGVGEGQTTPDMRFYLETVACLGTCFLAPAMMIDSLYFGKLTPQRVASVLSSFRAK